MQEAALMTGPEATGVRASADSEHCRLQRFVPEPIAPKAR